MRTDPQGVLGPTEGWARGPEWRRTSRGFYVPSEVVRTADQRIVEASAVLPSFGGVTGWAALRWSGARWFEGLRQGGREERPVTLAVADRSIRPQTGIATSEERLDPKELMVHRGIVVTTPLRSLCFEMRYAVSDIEAVQAADMAAYADLVSRGELHAFLTVNPRWIGIGRCRVGASDMAENAWSPPEVTMRRVWEHEAGLPRPWCNHPVFDLLGHHLGTPDLLDPVNGVAGEYNGSSHLNGAQRARDLNRESLFRRVGLECVEMLAGDLTDTSAFVRRLLDGYARAARLPAADRRWTAALPPWWVPTFTVDQRRNLDDGQRARLLQYRKVG